MNKFIKYTLVAFVVAACMLGSFSGGLVTGRMLPASFLPMLPQPVSTPEGAKSATPDDLQTLFKPFWESWKLVHEKYVDQPVDDTKLMQGAITGMMESLGDQHTSYMSPSDYEQASTLLNGSYDGIGAFVDTTGEYLTIVSPMNDSPAMKMGLKAGDQIIKINGEDMTGIPGDLVIKKVLGPAGTDVTLTIFRKGEELFDVTVTRAHIVMKSAEGKMLEDNIAYVQVNTFGESTTRELKDTLKELMANNPDGLILDLRNNGGGYLETAIDVSSQFIDHGTIMFEKYGNGDVKEHKARAGGLATSIPIVVLINEGSASASEIVAGALQDTKRGKLVGVISYGKGSVQDWVPLSDGQGAVRITVAKWLTPLKRTIHKVGLTPDVVAEITEEDFDADRDPQLDAAIKTLLEMIK
jgi:carboxyl-terminal processing protease